jgi:hypothetical protein
MVLILGLTIVIDYNGVLFPAGKSVAEGERIKIFHIIFLGYILIVTQVKDDYTSCEGMGCSP